MTGQSESSRAWRQRNPEVYRFQKRGQYARHRALLELAKRHPEEFAELVELERAEAGLPPKGTVVGRGHRLIDLT